MVYNFSPAVDLVLRQLSRAQSNQLTLFGTVYRPDFILLQFAEVFERRGLDRLLSRSPHNFLAFVDKIVNVVDPRNLRSQDM